MFIAWHDTLTVFVFVWFLIGALASGGMIWVSMGFTGKFPWEAIPIFFFAPIILLVRICGPALPIVLALVLAGAIAWLFRWAIA
jgi:hypothetical protein